MPTIQDNDGNSIIQCGVPGCKGVIVVGPNETAEGWWIGDNGQDYCPTHRELAGALPVLPKKGRKSPASEPLPLAKVKPVRPSGLRRAVYKAESAADIITVHMLESLDWLQGLIRCDEIPLDQRLSAVQNLIKAGQVVIPKSSAPVTTKPGAASKKETANPTSSVPRSEVEELIRMFSQTDLPLPDAQTPSTEDVPEGETPSEGEEGFEPVDYDGEEDPRPVIPNLAPPNGRRKLTPEEKVLRTLREKGDLPLKKLEGCFMTGVGFTIFPDWQKRIKRMVKQKLLVAYPVGNGHRYGVPNKKLDEEQPEAGPPKEGEAE